MLNVLKDFIQNAVKDLILPVRQRQNETGDGARAAKVYRMRVPSSRDAERQVPYIIVQLAEGTDIQNAGQTIDASAEVRLVFAVYCRDEEEGSMHLLNLMERVRIALLRTVIIGGMYEIDLTKGVDAMPYPDDTAPYYIGSMDFTVKTPAVEREVERYL